MRREISCTYIFDIIIIVLINPPKLLDVDKFVLY